MMVKTVILMILLTIPVFSFSKSWGSWKGFKNHSQGLASIKLKNHQYISIKQSPFLYQTPEVSAVLPYLLVKLYQKIHVIPAHKKQKGTCPCWPSCSAYARLSLEKYGGFMGTIMTIDRLLLRENNHFVHKHNLKIYFETFWKYWDPPELNNIFISTKIPYYEKLFLLTPKQVLDGEVE